ncbi:MAG: hypothetical protein JXA93_08440 [Anaerolineae bacterium]|nr:hypothetical protein [Anaerolineae bacterium]
MFRKGAILFVLLFVMVNTTAFAAPLARAEEGGNPWWLWLIVFAVLALFVGFMLWWWLHEPEEEEVATVTRHHQETEETLAARAEALDLEPVELEVVEPPIVQPEAAALDAVAPDNLTIVEGIGPAIQKVLHAAGINTYRDLAAADPDRLRAILEEADSKLARLFDPTTWPEQAQLAAEGNWEGLKALKDRLTAGRRA